MRLHVRVFDTKQHTLACEMATPAVAIQWGMLCRRQAAHCTNQAARVAYLFQQLYADATADMQCQPKIGHVPYALCTLYCEPGQGHSSCCATTEVLSYAALLNISYGIHVALVKDVHTNQPLDCRAVACKQSCFSSQHGRLTSTCIHASNMHLY